MGLDPPCFHSNLVIVVAPRDRCASRNTVAQRWTLAEFISNQACSELTDYSVCPFGLASGDLVRELEIGWPGRFKSLIKGNEF